MLTAKERRSLFTLWFERIRSKLTPTCWEHELPGLGLACSAQWSSCCPFLVCKRGDKLHSKAFIEPDNNTLSKMSISQNSNTYTALDTEPHSVASRKSWMERSGQQHIMTRKCRSQRLRIPWKQNNYYHILNIYQHTLTCQGITSKIFILTSVSWIYIWFSTTRIFLTPVRWEKYHCIGYIGQ